ncbi:MAG: hypothetical protein F6J87_02835 [Spirulina sp. SIO3F2]|nr:hypothetical protein [Spirulina sp. SIO3F2]
MWKLDMSWVTDILLIFSIGEFFDEDEEPEKLLALATINDWLITNDFTSLTNLDQHVIGGKGMQACVYGGAFNHFRTQDFIKVVKSQLWKQPQSVQLLIQDEDDEYFTMHTIK